MKIKPSVFWVARRYGGDEIELKISLCHEDMPGINQDQFDKMCDHISEVFDESSEKYGKGFFIDLPDFEIDQK